MIGAGRKRKTAGNLWLLAASLIFYAYGEPQFVFVMLGSILVNYLAALWIDRVGRENTLFRKILLIFDIAVNLTLLFIYKYLDFTWINLSRAIRLFGFDIPTPSAGIVLPIGISFFTFQAISYVADVYTGRGRVQKNPFNVALYISFFPQLIAGPIVRYQTVAEEIQARTETVDDFARGIERFIAGLAKKVLLANHLAILVDQAYYALAENRLTAGFGWMAAFAYALQIYFDFSGYSDMAIGLGLMFGFHFEENFDHPYTASTLSEFWRRWHISLSAWFRDYVYIPLGGNRVRTRRRLLLNLFAVWFLTGAWHGAGWKYILWGMMHFAVIVAEKVFGVEKKVKTSTVFAVLYRVFTFVYVLLAWVVFRADRLPDAIRYLCTMAGLGRSALWDRATGGMLAEFWPILLIALLCCLDWKKLLQKAADRLEAKAAPAVWLFKTVCLALLAFVSFSFLTVSSYNPFIYFNF